MTRVSDRAKFVKLAVMRVTRALNEIRLINNLSDRSNYAYDDADVNRMFQARGEELAVCRRRFEASRRRRNPRPQFTLEAEAPR